MSNNVYSIRIDDRVRRMMDEMTDVNWQAEIRQSVERMVREKKKQKLLEEAKELWKDQIPNKARGRRDDKGGSGCQMRWSLIRV